MVMRTFLKVGCGLKELASAEGYLDVNPQAASVKQHSKFTNGES
jgi:hypothetical protein